MTVRLKAPWAGQLIGTLYTGSDEGYLIGVGKASIEIGGGQIHVNRDGTQTLRTGDATRVISATNATATAIRVGTFYFSQAPIGVLATIRKDGAGTVTISSDDGTVIGTLTATGQTAIVRKLDGGTIAIDGSAAVTMPNVNYPTGSAAGGSGGGTVVAPGTGGGTTPTPAARMVLGSPGWAIPNLFSPFEVGNTNVTINQYVEVEQNFIARPGNTVNMFVTGDRAYTARGTTGSRKIVRVQAIHLASGQTFDCTTLDGSVVLDGTNAGVTQEQGALIGFKCGAIPAGPCGIRTWDDAPVGYKRNNMFQNIAAFKGSTTPFHTGTGAPAARTGNTPSVSYGGMWGHWDDLGYTPLPSVVTTGDSSEAEYQNLSTTLGSTQGGGIVPNLHLAVSGTGLDFFFGSTVTGPRADSGITLLKEINTLLGNTKPFWKQMLVQHWRNQVGANPDSFVNDLKAHLTETKKLDPNMQLFAVVPEAFTQGGSTVPQTPVPASLWTELSDQVPVAIPQRDFYINWLTTVVNGKPGSGFLDGYFDYRPTFAPTGADYNKFPIATVGPRGLYRGVDTTRTSGTNYWYIVDFAPVTLSAYVIGNADNTAFEVVRTEGNAVVDLGGGRYSFKAKTQITTPLTPDVTRFMTTASVDGTHRTRAYALLTINNPSWLQDKANLIAKAGNYVN